MDDEKAAKNGRPEENRSKRTVEEDCEGHRACEKGSQSEFQHRGCGEEIPRKPGNVRRADRVRFRPAPPSHRMGRSASAGLTPLRHSDAPSAHSQAQPVRRFALNPARTACRDRDEGAAGPDTDRSPPVNGEAGFASRAWPRGADPCRLPTGNGCLPRAHGGGGLDACLGSPSRAPCG